MSYILCIHLPSLLTFKTNHEINSQNSQQQSNIYPPIFRTAHAQNQSVKFHGTKAWNTGFPAEIKELQFEKKYRHYTCTQ